MTPFTDAQAERIRAAGGIVFDAESRAGAWVKVDSQLNVFPQPGNLGYKPTDLTQRTEETGPLRTAFHAHAVLPGPVSITRSVHRAADGRPAILVATRGPYGALAERRDNGIRVLHTMDEAIDHALAESCRAVGASSRLSGGALPPTTSPLRNPTAAAPRRTPGPMERDGYFEQLISDRMGAQYGRFHARYMSGSWPPQGRIGAAPQVQVAQP